MIFSFKYDGAAYEFDDERMGLGEARWIKKETGLYGRAFFEAAQDLDPDALSCMVVIAMRRAGLTETNIDEVCANENAYFEMVETAQVRPTETAEPKKVRRVPTATKTKAASQS